MEGKEKLSDILSAGTEALSKAVNDSYQCGFADGMELMKNCIKVDGLWWCQLNFGATTEMDFNFGETSMGKLMTWDEANGDELLRLPSRDEFYCLWRDTNHELVFNTPFGNRQYWGVFNDRIHCKINANNYVSIYHSGILDSEGNVLGRSPEGSYAGSVRLWLADEVSENEALSVRIDLIVRDKSDSGTILQPVYEPLPKDYKITSHCVLR